MPEEEYNPYAAPVEEVAPPDDVSLGEAERLLKRVRAGIGWFFLLQIGQCAGLSIQVISWLVMLGIAAAIGPAIIRYRLVRTGLYLTLMTLACGAIGLSMSLGRFTSPGFVAVLLVVFVVQPIFLTSAFHEVAVAEDRQKFLYRQERLRKRG